MNVAVSCCCRFPPFGQKVSAGGHHQEREVGRRRGSGKWALVSPSRRLEVRPACQRHESMGDTCDVTLRTACISVGADTRN
jgi:hypothetical protein